MSSLLENKQRTLFKTQKFIKMIKKNFWIFFLILFIFFTDRLSKMAIIDSLEAYGQTNIIITNYLSLNLIWNDGIAFGLFSFDQKNSYNILTVIIIFITSVILWMIIKTKGMEKVAFTMDTQADEKHIIANELNLDIVLDDAPHHIQ